MPYYRWLSRTVKVCSGALAGVAQGTEQQPESQRVAGSIPSQGTCLGCGPGPQQGVGKKQPHSDVSPLSFSLPSPLSLKIKSFFKKKKKDLLQNPLLYISVTWNIPTWRPTLCRWQEKR